ncbi:uncharacterized protein LOC143265448 [Megachile rotundata]|uniref:uncharacterized protein LOC143265448 n=1 Tax=Megachile rotundata TaxID=143995 RepID=UPI003FD483F7
MKTSRSPGCTVTRGTIERREEGERSRRERRERSIEEFRKWEKEMSSEEFEERGEEGVKEETVLLEGDRKEKREEEENEGLRSLRKDWALEFLAEEKEVVLAAAVKERKKLEKEEEREEEKEGERMETEECKKRMREAETEEEQHEDERKRRVAERVGKVKIVENRELTNQERERLVIGEGTTVKLVSVEAPTMVALDGKKRERGELRDDATEIGHCDTECVVERSIETKEGETVKDVYTKEVREDALGQKYLRRRGRRQTAC